jgi:hypothetical protein
MSLFIVTHDKKYQLFLYALLIENVNFFICIVDESKKFSKIVKKIASDVGCKKNC